MKSVTYVDVIDLLGKRNPCSEFHQIVDRLGECPESFSPKEFAYVFEFFASGLMLVVMDDFFTFAYLKAKNGKLYSRFDAFPAGISHSDLRTDVRNRFYNPPVYSKQINESITSDRYMLSDSKSTADASFTDISVLAVFAMSDFSLCELSLSRCTVAGKI